MGVLEGGGEEKRGDGGEVGECEGDFGLADVGVTVVVEKAGLYIVVTMMAREWL